MSTVYKTTIGISVGVTTLIGLFSVMPSSLAVTSSSTKNAVVTVGASCSMNSTVSTAHTATIAQGNYNKEIGLTEVTTTCNDAGGYAIYAVGYGDDTLGNNVLHSATVGSTYDIATGNDFANATSSYTSNTSQWAMRVETVPGQTDSPTITNNYDSLSLVPTTYTKVAQYNANTSTPSTSSITTEYGAYIAIGQPAGTYTGKVKYTLVHPSSAAAPAMPEQPIAQCPNKVPGITYMQEITDQNKATVMANMTPNQQYYLRDRRDETPYCVSNIATQNANNEDQNAIWMTQNLRITGTISATDSNFTGSDFNVSAYDLKTDGAEGGVCERYSGGYDNVCSHVPDANDLTTTGLTAEEIGVWYNYAAATAGTITGDINTTEATEDICPAGWSLPSDDDTKPANSINSLLGNTYVSVFSHVTGGYYTSGWINLTDYGYWWSSKVSNNYGRSILYYNRSSLIINTYHRINGMFIRCVRQ